MGFYLRLKPVKSFVGDFTKFSLNILSFFENKEFLNEVGVEKITKGNALYITKDKDEIQIEPDEIEITSLEGTSKESAEKVKKIIFLIMEKIFVSDFRIKFILFATVDFKYEIYPELKEIKNFKDFEIDSVSFKDRNTYLEIYKVPKQIGQHIHFSYKAEIEMKELKDSKIFDTFFEKLEKKVGVPSAN